MGWEYAVICTFQLQNIKIFYKRHDLTHDFGSYHSLRDHLLMSDSLLHLRDMFSNNRHVQFPLHLRFFFQGWASCSSLVGWDTDPMCTSTAVICKSRTHPWAETVPMPAAARRAGLRPFVGLDIAWNLSLFRGAFIQCWLASDNARVSYCVSSLIKRTAIWRAKTGEDWEDHGQVKWTCLMYRLFSSTLIVKDASLRWATGVIHHKSSLHSFTWRCLAASWVL